MSADKLKNIERKLDDQLKKVNRSTTTTLAVYALLIIFFIAYLGYTSTLLSQIDADGITDTAVGMAEEKLPEFRQQLTDQLVSGAEDNINNALDQMMAQLPAQRERLENLANAQVNKQLIVADESFSELFQSSLQSGKTELKPMLEKIENAKSTEEFEDEVYRILKAQVETPEIMANISDYGQALVDVSDKITHLRNENNLTESEKIELELLIALKEVSVRSDVQNLDLGNNN